MKDLFSGRIARRRVILAGMLAPMMVACGHVIDPTFSQVPLYDMPSAVVVQSPPVQLSTAACCVPVSASMSNMAPSAMVGTMDGMSPNRYDGTMLVQQAPITIQRPSLTIPQAPIWVGNPPVPIPSPPLVINQPPIVYDQPGIVIHPPRVEFARPVILMPPPPPPPPPVVNRPAEPPPVYTPPPAPPPPREPERRPVQPTFKNEDVLPPK